MPGLRRPGRLSGRIPNSSTWFVLAGARNVAFVWSVAAQGGDPAVGGLPGQRLVNWIAAWESRTNTVRTSTFARYFGLWYSTFSTYGKPMMVGPTATSTSSQVPYLQQVAAPALAHPVPTDQSFRVLGCSGPGRLRKFKLGPAGLQAFRSSLKEDASRPKRHAAQSPSPPRRNPDAAGQSVQLTASTVVPTQGGTITFYANGAPVSAPTARPSPSPSRPPARPTPYPAGDSTVRAVYSGDAEYSGARSPPIRVVVNEG